MIILLIQARCGSSRLQKKVLLNLNNKPIINHIYDRCNLCNQLDKIIILTSTNTEDDVIEKHCNQNNFDCYRGDERDLLNRYYYLCKLIKPDTIIRVTADCPFIDTTILDNMITYYKNNNFDYVYNTDENDKYNIYPEGSDFEIFNFNTLEYIWKNEKDIREHCTGCIRIKRNYYENIFKINLYDSKLITTYLKHNFNGIHLSIDKISDYNVASFIYNNFKEKEFFSYQDILNFLDENYDEYIKIKDEKSYYTKTQNLYKKAKQIIPGGNKLLSKIPEIFLQENWPSYYSKVEGIEITDLDGNKYLDMGFNVISSCILGANDKDINNAVIEYLNRGIISSLNHPNELALTEKLIELHLWAGMAIYTRTSCEACKIAINIARTYSKKYKIAFCVYNELNYWYFSKNINNNLLDKYLLTELPTTGTSQIVEGNIYPFSYNKIKELEEILEKNEIGVIIIEPIINIYPENNFLQKIRELANKYNCVLIFDEITSGFRITNGGIHKILNVEPDVAVFGKGISNGFPLGVILGKKEIMESTQDTIMSSKYEIDGIGVTAAIATINKFIDKDISSYIKNLGLYFQEKLKDIANKIKIKLNVTGNLGIISFSFNYDNSLSIEKLFIQEMLKIGYLTTCVLYLTNSHTKKDIDNYILKISDFFIKYKEDIENNNIEKYLINNSFIEKN